MILRFLQSMLLTALPLLGTGCVMSATNHIKYLSEVMNDKDFGSASPRSRKEIDAFLRALFENDQRANPEACLIAAVTTHGMTEYYIYGKTCETRKYYSVGSISKTMTAAVVAKLVEDGRMSYDDPVAGSTLSQLLTHTAGLSDFHFDQRSLNAIAGFTLKGENIFSNISPSILDAIASATNEPRYHYSSLGYALVQRHLESKTGQSMVKLISENLLERLGMRHTLDDPPLEERMLGYPGEYPFFQSRAEPLPLRLSYGNPLLLASCGYWSTVDDLVILTEAIRQSKGFLRDLTVPHAIDEQGRVITTGLTYETIDGYNLAFKRGLQYGHSSYIGFTKDVSVVVLKNSIQLQDSIGNSLLLAVSSHFKPNPMESGAPNPLPPPPDGHGAAPHTP